MYCNFKNIFSLEIIREIHSYELYFMKFSIVQPNLIDGYEKSSIKSTCLRILNRKHMLDNKQIKFDNNDTSSSKATTKPLKKQTYMQNIERLPTVTARRLGLCYAVHRCNSCNKRNTWSAISPPFPTVSSSAHQTLGCL